MGEATSATVGTFFPESMRWSIAWREVTGGVRVLTFTLDSHADWDLPEWPLIERIDTEGLHG